MDAPLCGNCCESSARPRRNRFARRPGGRSRGCGFWTSSSRRKSKRSCGEALPSRGRRRKRYPRALRAEIPIGVSFEVPFLDEEPGRVRPRNLEWSHRVLGTRRATLEEFSPWVSGRGQARFSIVPGDFEANGPHRLVLQARVRTTGLTDSWEIELPHVPFNLEFDPFLRARAPSRPWPTRPATFRSRGPFDSRPERLATASRRRILRWALSGQSGTRRNLPSRHHCRATCRMRSRSNSRAFRSAWQPER